MGEVHSLIIRHGVNVARSMAATKAERNAIEAAASIMGEEESHMGITHAGFAMTSLRTNALKKPSGVGQVQIRHSWWHPATQSRAVQSASHMDRLPG
jgi:hypothetical protein